MISPTVTPTLRNTLFTTIPSAGGIPYTDFGRVLDYSTDVGPFTIVDQSGEGNTATLYSGRGLTMDAVNDTVTYATGYSLANRTATLWGRFNTTSTVTMVTTQSGSFSFTPTATGVWEKLTATSQVSGDLFWLNGQDFDIGDLRIGTEHWTHNDWSDPTGDTSNGKTIVDSGPNQLHGTCTGCSGFTGEATIPQTADKNWNKGLFFNGVDEYLLASPSAFDPSADGQVVEFSLIQTGAPAGAEVLFGYRDQSTELIQITQQDSTTLLLQVRGSDNIIKSDSITVGAFSHITGTLTYNGVLKTASLVTNQGTATVSGFGTISTSIYLAIATSYAVAFGSFFNGLVAKMDVNGVDALQATQVGTPDQQLITASDANDQIDALGTAISEPRLNTQVVNLFGEGGLVTTPAAASLDTIKTVSGWIWHDATARTVFDLGTPTVGTTTTALTSSGFTGVTYFVNGASGTTLSAGWNHCVVASTAALATDDIDILAKSGSQIDYDVTLTVAEALVNYDAQKSLYGL